MSDWLYRLQDVEAQLPDDKAVFRLHYALRHGSMKFGLYAPRNPDVQGPHKQDELYFVISGSGRFVKNGEEKPVQKDDAVFIEAGADHRFIDVSDDFATWVVFWGPEGGEVP